MKSLLCRFLLLFLASLPLLPRSASTYIAKFSLKDNLQPGFLVGTISSKNKTIPPPVSTGYYRVIMEPNPLAERSFRIVQRTSRLYTKETLDRDALCRELGCCSRLLCGFNFTVFIGLTSASSVRVKVVIVFNDENDNAPVINPGSIALPESTPVGSIRALPAATDRDSDVNGVRSYTLKDRSGTFDLTSTKDGRPALRVAKKLDADNPAGRTYGLSYSAVDGGSPPKTGQVTLEVRVEDENDNAPIFEVNSRLEFVSEAAAVGTEVFRFEASDADSQPDNKRISYSLVSALSSPRDIASSKFAVNGVTGAITVKGKLDYDKPTERNFVLLVEAKDHGSPALSSTATLTVRLTNVNDNDPEITVTSAQELVEGAAAGQVVRTISVRDDDETSGLNINCSLKNSPDFAIKPITENHYFDIVTRRVFDYEVKNTAAVTIVCIDHRAPARTVEKTLEISIQDVNDHEPIFVRSLYTTTLPENAPLGSSVMTVRATDQDSGPRGIVRYSLDHNGARFFNVDKLRGILYINASLDRETNVTLNFKVWATDEDPKPLKAFTTVAVDVLDVNDNAPRLVSSRTVDVVENTKPGTVVTRVEFEDPDQGRNGTVRFSLKRGNNLSHKYFNMTPDGRIVVIAPIDRETTPNMYLDIEAHDLGTPSRSSTASLIVRILDLNDNTPRLVSPRNVTMLGFSPPLYADSPYNSTVVLLEAKDGDLRDNGTIDLAIVDTNATGMFKIKNRRLFTAWRYPSQPGHGIYHVRIRLSDNGRPPRSSLASLTVSVAPPSGIMKFAGVSNVVILVLILVCSAAIATALVIAILWARSRSKRPLPDNGRCSDYYDYESTLQRRLPLSPDLDSEVVSNTELMSDTAAVVGDSTIESGIHTLTRNNRPLSRTSQEFINPYPLTATIRSSHNKISFETFGHVPTPVSHSHSMENFNSVRPTAVVNAHLLQKMYEDDHRQSEHSYEDSGKGGSVDDVTRLVHAHHNPLPPIPPSQTSSIPSHSLPRPRHFTSSVPAHDKRSTPQSVDIETLC